MSATVYEINVLSGMFEYFPTVTARCTNCSENVFASAYVVSDD